LTTVFVFYTIVRYFSAFTGILIGRSELRLDSTPERSILTSDAQKTSIAPFPLGLITAVIPTKNSANTIGKCIESIQNSEDYGNVDILVVDNASTDNTRSIAQRFGATVMNGGPERSAQRNIGAMSSSGDYLLFIDSDMEFTPTVLRECNRAIREGVDAAIISEITVGNGYWANVRKLERASYFGDSLHEAARLFKKSAFFKMGGYDVQLTGLEDFDLQARIEGRRLKLAHLRAPILHHEETFNIKDHLAKKYYYASKSRAYLARYPKRSIAQFFPLRRTYLKRGSPVAHAPSVFVGLIFLKVAEVVVASIAVVTGRAKAN
jgi:glycosyltransferase involved in cell wall biosynthesis